MPQRLISLPGLFSICKLPAEADVPAWASAGGFVSITRTDDELSIVCPDNIVPAGVRCQRAWRCLRVAGTLDFNLVGVLSGLVAPLAEAGISVLAVSTFDTDYLLVKADKWEEALHALHKAGHTIG